MKKITVQFYDIDKYFSEIGGNLYVITVVSGIILLPLLQYCFFKDLRKLFIQKENIKNKSQMDKILKQTFSFEKLYEIINQAQSNYKNNSEIQ